MEKRNGEKDLVDLGIYLSVLRVSKKKKKTQKLSQRRIINIYCARGRAPDWMLPYGKSSYWGARETWTPTPRSVKSERRALLWQGQIWALPSCLAVLFSPWPWEGDMSSAWYFPATQKRKAPKCYWPIHITFCCLV